jgi:hypothetical protein
MKLNDLLTLYRDTNDQELLGVIADWYEENGDEENSRLYRRPNPVVEGVGPEETGMGEDQFLRCVYWYETGSYEGDGVAVIQRYDGGFVWVSLGHCSCYGPEDGVKTFRGEKPVTLEELEKVAGDPEEVVGFNESLWKCVQRMKELVSNSASGVGT